MALSRRHFLQLGGASLAWSMARGSVIGANERINLAAIGIGQQGGGITKVFGRNPHVNIVALCDVDIESNAPVAGVDANFGWMDEGKTPAACATLFTSAKKYRDFRKMFDEMGDDIDAVCIGAPDHTHFPIAMEAMRRGKHVFVEKPLARTFHECELLMEAEQKFGVVTQMGNQGHSGASYFQFKEWVEQGIIKDVYHVDARMNNPRRWHTNPPRTHPWGKVTGYPEAEPLPEGLDWELWHCAVPDDYGFSGKLHYGNWRGWHALGTGTFGDWGAHILDILHEFLELGLPEKISIKELEGPSELIFPMSCTLNFQFPERNGMPAMDIDWYEGPGNAPKLPKELDGVKTLNPGKVIYSKDYIFNGGAKHRPLEIVPREKYIEMLKSGEVRKDFGKHSDHYENFINAIRGLETTRSPFSVAGPLCQMFALGCIAQRLGGEIEFDRDTKQITNNTLANSLLQDRIREGWQDYYQL